MEIPNHVESSSEGEKSEAASDTSSDRDNNRLYGNNGFQGPLMENAEESDDNVANSTGYIINSATCHILPLLLLSFF